MTGNFPKKNRVTQTLTEDLWLISSTIEIEIEKERKWASVREKEKEREREKARDDTHILKIYISLQRYLQKYFW